MSGPTLEIGDRVKALRERSSRLADGMRGIEPGRTGTVRGLRCHGQIAEVTWDPTEEEFPHRGGLYYNYKLEKIPTLTLESLEKRVAQLETPEVDLAQETQDRTTVQNLTRHLTLAEIKLIRKYL